MSSDYGPKIKFTCFHDCQQHRGCPGHEVRAIYAGTGDMLSFEIDGNKRSIFDPQEFEAMVEAYQLYLQDLESEASGDTIPL